MNKVLKKAIDTYGTDMQLTVATEEFSEMTKEICKYKRGAKNIKNITEEMADCYIVLEEMLIIFNIDFNTVAKEIARKVDRLERRLTEYERSKNDKD